MKRKIKSILCAMVFAIIMVSFIPGALAAGDTTSPTALSFTPETGVTVGTESFTVSASGVYDPSGVKTVSFLVYNMEEGVLNQIEYNATDMGNGVWSRDIDLDNFGNKEGTYIINIWGRDTNDNKGLMGSIKVVIPAPASEKIEALIDAATAQLGKQYVLGGQGPDVFDCSGLVYYALNLSGYQIDYMTSGEWATSTYTIVGSMADLQRGDIVCFSGHVGIYLGDGTMIDASSSAGVVRISNDIENSTYCAANFICGRRVFFN